ncbi:MAG: ADP-forming succinate--CoA ligase subunit beta [bacterium]|nr:ADP-forming succinate--CoA ligase subunit beta [bacterium]
MKIHEYQAKAIMAESGIPVPKGEVAETPEQAREIAARLGGMVAVKAQVHAGGRGKAGGIKLASSPQEVVKAAAELLGKRLVTHQTSPEGLPITRVLIEEVVPVYRELYLSLLTDPGARMPMMMASGAGGMDIEEVAAKTPEKILKVHIDLVAGFRPYQARNLAYGLKLEGEQAKAAGSLMAGLYRVFQSKDCSLAEINPLVVAQDGRLLALDAKLNFDDNALFRHADITALRDLSQEDPLEVAASKGRCTYIKLNGTVGCMVNGAGLAMATMDMIQQMGAQPANFLDVGGGASADQVSNAFRILVSDPKVKAVLINLFGGILRCDIAATGLIDAYKQVKVKVPVVVRMRGTNLQEGLRLLSESGLDIIMVQDLRQAALRAVAAAKAAA